MLRRRNPLRFPSYRNLQIYHAWACERRTQAKIAAAYGLSQRRISQVGQQVEAWIRSRVSFHEFTANNGLRFHLAVARERMRLHHDHDPLLEMFVGEDGEERYLRRSVQVVGGEALHTVEISEKPNGRLMNHALAVQIRLAELEAIGNLGPFADLPNKVQQTITERYVKPQEAARSPKSSNLRASAAIFSSNAHANACSATPEPSNARANTF
jgi:hypothetical protein